MGILQKIRSVAKNRTTYRVGILQAKAYRILKQKTADILKPYHITTFEWAFLGLVADHKSIRPKKAAVELGVEPPFVTQMVRGLKAKGFVVENKDPEDTRAKIISLTPNGVKIVSIVEPIVKLQIRPLLKGVGINELMGYLSVLEKISANGKRWD